MLYPNMYVTPAAVIPASTILKAPLEGDLLLAIDTPPPARANAVKLIKALDIITFDP